MVNSLNVARGEFVKYLKLNWTELLFGGLLCLTVFALYSLGYTNKLIFDDVQLEGNIAQNYVSFFQIKPRILSYGSFNWLDSMFGGGVRVQRAVNVVLHLCVCWSIYRLFALLIPFSTPGTEVGQDASLAKPQVAALRLGVCFYAVNPVAVYAVGYLVQRSIVMATLFCVLACWAFARAVISQRAVWYFLALFLYLLAVFSKEHAFLLPLIGAPIFIFLRRPTWRRVAVYSIPLLFLVGLGLSLVLHFYPNLVGRVFDSASVELVGQLEKLRPGISEHIYALSVFNEAALFFYYIFLWLLPLPGFLSIDMHPPFPLWFGALPHLFGAVAYVILFCAAVFAIFRQSAMQRFLGMCALIALILYFTEFSTVWVQDPFVLYRSYLWMFPIPGVVAVAFSGFSPQVLYKGLAVLAVALCSASADRILSLRDSRSVWTDVVEKSPVPGEASAVGRGRAYVNRGMDNLRLGELEYALKDFRNGEQLGEVGGRAWFAIGQTEQAMGRHEDALRSFDRAESSGYSDNLLHFHRGQSQYALGRFVAAEVSYGKALSQTLGDVPKKQANTHMAEIYMRSDRFSEAIIVYRKLLSDSPSDARFIVGLGLAQLGMKEAVEALKTFDDLLLVKSDPLAFYGRALANYQLGKRDAALSDIGKAIQLDRGNAVYLQVETSMRRGEKLSL